MEEDETARDLFAFYFKGWPVEIWHEGDRRREGPGQNLAGLIAAAKSSNSLVLRPQAYRIRAIESAASELEVAVSSSGYDVERIYRICADPLALPAGRPGEGEGANACAGLLREDQKREVCDQRERVQRHLADVLEESAIEMERTGMTLSVPLESPQRETMTLATLLDLTRRVNLVRSLCGGSKRRTEDDEEQ